MKKKILVVDDDPGIIEIFKIILEENGYHVLIAEDQKIIERVRSEIPDLILLDIWISGLDGRDIARALRKETGTKEIPIIMISALSDTKRIAEESGVDAFLEKPFNIDTLLSLVQKYTSTTPA